ncbi:serpin family protein [Planosporangium mesophilum]|uniref:Serpin domain-containing protein n=1 Tax=Planosporangium mesophilum TaxID=689768 RepID=A0A8J3X244_9ACTN|nr:serpin family protein [Planosporangium mesophilum]NJC85867.1 hypothetical protein [Planosporangium mesophilum]GII25085.1 hypothetical protein Pme01_46820 [Planosporangium mesophilum]
MTTTTAGLYRPLAGYAETLHATAGWSHHVASPLGAWLVLALCAPASSGTTRDELTRVLGTDADTAAAAAADLLGNRHPLVMAAAGLWYREGGGTQALADWLARLPDQVETGDLPSQAQLDAWADRNTDGLIDRFPLKLRPETVLVLATALATRVSWQRPFDVVPATALGPASAWAGQVDRVLHTPDGPGHTQYIATSSRAGDVAVHTAHARGGLLVTSVAATPEVPTPDVLAAAYELAHAAATGGSVARHSLFELPLGDTPLWTLTERTAPVKAPDGREERCTAVLPAWSARSQHQLEHDELGFPAAARTLAEVLGLPAYGYEARQSAVARYSREGFEAAAVTGMMELTSFTPPREGVVRTAELRFGHPYAVVAVAVDEDRLGGAPGPWHGLPVFSAWVAEVEDAEEDDPR